MSTSEGRPGSYWYADDDARSTSVMEAMRSYRAAEVAIRTMIAEFWGASRPLFDPDGFLHLTVGRAHDAVVALGHHRPGHGHAEVAG